MKRLKKAALGASCLALLPIAAMAALGDESDASAYCPRFGDVGQTGVTAGEMGLREASGVIASAQNPGVFWTHNDNSGQNRIFALDASGAVLATFWLQDTRTGSIEDIAFGTGPDGRDWIYLGDFGDNRMARNQVALHRFPEPEVDMSWRLADKRIPVDDIETIRYRYRQPGTSTTWSRDSEALAVDPESGDMFIFEKHLMHRDGLTQASYVYRIPAADLTPGELRIAEPVSLIRARTVDTGAGITAAEISRDGSMVIAKNMREVFVWARQPGETVADVLNANPEAPCRAPAQIGEAIAVTPDHSALVMIREGLKTPIWWVPITDGIVIRDDVIDIEEPKEPRDTLPTIGGAGDDPAVDPDSDPVVDPDGDPVVDPDGDPVGDPVVDPDGDPDGDPVVDPVADPGVDPDGDQVLEPELRTETVDPVDVDADGSDNVAIVGGASCNDLPATIIGTNGDDVIEGTPGDDVIAGGAGNDVINGRGGNDVICGHEGDDELRGSVGNDIIFGGDGHDRIFGGSGNDLIRGHDGDDKMYGGPGDDILAGNRGNDVLVGAEDTDRLIARDTGDICYEGTHEEGSVDCRLLA